MKGEEPIQELDLAGLENAPGVFDDVTQRCRVVFTNQNRLVFTQVRVCAVYCTTFAAANLCPPPRSSALPALPARFSRRRRW